MNFSFDDLVRRKSNLVKGDLPCQRTGQFVAWPTDLVPEVFYEKRGRYVKK